MAEKKKGYLISVAYDTFYIPDALHIERDDELMMYDGDFEAAKAAEQDGIKLIYGMRDVPDGIYIDTPENREIILTGLEREPEYRDWKSQLDPDFVAEMCFGKG